MESEAVFGSRSSQYFDQTASVVRGRRNNDESGPTSFAASAADSRLASLCPSRRDMAGTPCHRLEGRVENRRDQCPPTTPNRLNTMDNYGPRTVVTKSNRFKGFNVLIAVLTCVMVTGHSSMMVKGLPLTSTSEGGNTLTKRASDSAVTQAVEFLSTFGYLPRSSSASGNLRTDEQLKKAIKIMQKFGGISETGEVDAETVKLMKRKRCGMPDLIGNADRVRRYALQGQFWSKNVLTWSITEQTYAYIEKNMARRTITRALKVWSEQANLTFTEVARSDADIVVSFRKRYHEDGYPFDGKGSVLAHAFFPGEGIGGDAHFDADETWVESDRDLQGDAINLFSVAAHEFGHSLGLSHSSIQGSLMFPYYQHVNDNFKLPYDDTVGIQQLYGPKTRVKWASMPPMAPTRPPAPENPKTRPTVRGSKPNANPNPNPSFPDEPEPPQTCDTSVDSVATIRREIFFFKDWYFWRRDDRGLKTKHPVAIDIFWYGVPSDVGKFDAVYERQSDSKILFFSGQKYWVFHANNPESGYPKNITELGLPANLPRLDSAMVWGHNGKTYFFSGNQYWRFDENKGKVDPDYPRNMALWKGVPRNMDAAFQHKGITYFFKGKHYWKFDDKLMRTTPDSPKLISETWFDCPPNGVRAPLPPIEGASTALNSAANLNLRTELSLFNSFFTMTSLLYVFLRGA